MERTLSVRAAQLRVLLRAGALLSSAALLSGCVYQCPPGQCYAGYRQSALRSADMGGRALGRSVATGSPGRVNPYWAAVPFYDAWLNSFANSIVP